MKRIAAFLGFFALPICFSPPLHAQQSRIPVEQLQIYVDGFHNYKRDASLPAEKQKQMRVTHYCQGGNSLVSASAPARANADPQAERELRAAYDEIHTAILEHDPAVIEKYYGPDYVMTFSDGARGNFENSLHVLSDENRNKWHSHNVSNENFLFYGDTAIATLTVHSRWFGRGKEHDVREHLTQTWVRRAARWTLVATQATLIDPSQE